MKLGSLCSGIIGNGVVPQCAAAALEYLLGLEVAA